MAIRNNACPNPGLKVNAAGWFGGARVNVTGFPRPQAFQISSNTDGGPPRGDITGGQQHTLSGYVRVNASGTLSLRIHWYRNGAYLSQTSNVGFEVSTNVIRRVNITATAPSTADEALLFFPSVGATRTVTAVLIEQGGLGDYFDGDSPGGSWTGTDGLSPSTLQTALAPTVDAGPDTTGDQHEPFTRTAAENDNGAAITSRAWTVLSGPGQAGETIGSAAALSWTPHTPGVYTLRYTATNATGPGSDDVTVTVTAVDHPATATLRLAAARSGAKQVTAGRAAALTLTATAEAGPRQAIGAATATLTLTATVVGVRNGVTATMRLTADIGATTSSRAAPAAADPLRLTAGPAATTTARAGAVAAAGLRLTASILAERIISAVRGVAARPSLAITHELVVVARVPQASGPPALMEVDAVTWSGLSWTDELSKPQTLTAGCKIASLTEPILQRLRAPADLPTEIWLYRNGKLTFAGPLLGAQVQGESLSLTARGLLAYLDFMAIEAPDLVFTQTDQTIMAKTMVDRWQATPYGHFGIDTTGIVPSGVLRDGTYLYREDHKVGRRIVELGARINGFDTAVDPASRQLILAHPRQGQDRSSGEDAVVFDASNITSPNLVWSAAPGDVASDVFGTGTGSSSDPVYGHQFNEQLRARFGRCATFATFDGVSEQGTLDDHLAAMRDVRGQIVTVPGPDTRVTPDSDLDGYDVGDTVSYALHELLSVQAPFRLLKRQVTASQTGQEAVSVAFV